MRLTTALMSPPKFHFWKDFGAGRAPHVPYYKHWWNIWRRKIWTKKFPDHTLSIEQLPPGSRVMDAEDFMIGPMNAMPDELIRMKNERVLYNHPWPFNIQTDDELQKDHVHSYTIDSRFYVPRHDSQVLTNTILECDDLQADPPLQLTDDHIALAQRQYDWATKGDSVMIRLPRKKVWPMLNRSGRARYGLSKERQEMNTLLSFNDICQNILTQYYYEQNMDQQYKEIIGRTSLAFPYCQALFDRDGTKLNLNLTIDSVTLGKAPLPQLDCELERTRDTKPVDISPRTWRSLIEPSVRYQPNWTFTLPRDAHLHTMLIGSRINRQHRIKDEMLARTLVHAFGMASQVARLRAYEMDPEQAKSNKTNVIMGHPLELTSVRAVDRADRLAKPVVTQVIGYDLDNNDFHFLRYQLNTTNFADKDERRIKNQAWYSGPITDLHEVLRYYLDFASLTSAKTESVSKRRQSV